IDQAVIDTCREHLPTVSSGAFDDPRVKVHVADAFGFVEAATSAYDLIILDSTDTYEDEVGELSEALFTSAFYKDCARALAPGGYAVTQADNPVFCAYSLEEIRRQFATAFPCTGSYLGLVPSFGGYSAFFYGSSSKPLRPTWDASWTESSYLTAATYNLALSGLTF
ncbi:MAG TPA: hypothetical protein VKT78_04270, partial [Fimbriimonadaceae bacterium]|nr:hypothetical protein [Fimbriimonadaceae bacterium]